MTPVPLEEAREEARYGGKAVQLGAALRAGLPVPAGVALPCDLVDACAGGDPAATHAVAAAWSTLGPRVAVRSSAVGEDSSTASFAGQHLSCLNVISAEGLVAAVGRVWRSGRSEAALAYRRRLGIDGSPRVAVVVQRMLAPTCAGVLFTRDPVTGRDERVIEASWGLGEAVVAGLVTPDRYRLDRDGRVLERSAGTKDLMLVARDDGDTEQVPVAPARVRALCVDDHGLALLAALARRCEAAWGTGAHDLEFAFTGSVIHLLQRRAVTRAAAPQEITARGADRWTR